MPTAMPSREMSDLAQLLRSSRLRKGRSIRQLADRCGIGRSTISRWECGSSKPSKQALESVLNSLNLCEEDRAPFAEYLCEKKNLDPQSVARRRLLRAARLRNGLSLGEAAARIGVSKATLSRWESGDRKPDRSRLADAARAIGASVLEIGAIASLGPLTVDTGIGIEQLQERVQLLRVGIPVGSSKIGDLDFLGLDASIAASSSAEAKRLRIELRSAYVEWLGWWYRDAEAGRYATKLLPSLRKDPSSPVWGRLLRACANFASELRGEPEAGIELLGGACRALSGGQSEGFVRRELAGLYLTVGDPKSAREELHRARDANSLEEGLSVHLYCCSMVEATIWSELGEHERAALCLPTQKMRDPYLRCSSAIGKSRILLRAGYADSARNVLEEAMADAKNDGFQHFYDGLRNVMINELPD